MDSRTNRTDLPVQRSASLCMLPGIFAAVEGSFLREIRMIDATNPGRRPTAALCDRLRDRGMERDLSIAIAPPLRPRVRRAARDVRSGRRLADLPCPREPRCRG